MSYPYGSAWGRVLGWVVALALWGAGAQATTIQVSTTADTLTDGDGCSLREAVRNANADSSVHPDCDAGDGEDLILVPAGYYSLDIQKPSSGEDAAAIGDLDVTDSVEIRGEGFETTIIDAHARVFDSTHDRAFDLKGTAVHVKLQELTVRGGATFDGSGIRSAAGSLELVACRLMDNVGLGSGGAIWQQGGSLLVSGSVIRANHADFGGGIYAEQVNVQIVRSSIDKNSAFDQVFAGGSGGGMLFDSGSGSQLAIENSTISANLAGGDQPVGGGVHILGADYSASIVHSTLASNNLVGSGNAELPLEGSQIWAGGLGSLDISNSVIAGGDCFGSPSSQGGNVESPGATCSLNGAGDLDGVPLADLDLKGTAVNAGGRTLVRPLGTSSVALGRAVQESCPPVDQRNFDRSQGGPCDSGAFELGAGGSIFIDDFESGDAVAWSWSVGD